MFSNNVFKVSVDTKKWFKKAGVRAVKTMALPESRIRSAVGSSNRGS